MKITKENKMYSEMILKFTHDYNNVVVGDTAINRHGESYLITEIDKDECGRKRLWSNDEVLCIQYTTPHNMLTKPPFFAFEYENKK